MSINVNTFNQYNNWGRTVDIELEWSSLDIPSTICGTGDVGKLMPIYIRELIPGQTINLQLQIGIQFMPFVSNVLHRFHGTIRNYFVPIRLLDPEWENFIQGGIDGKNAYTMPYIDLAGYKNQNNGTLVHTVLDYMGYPINNNFTELPTDSPDNKHNRLGLPAAYPVWAYNKVYNDQIRPVDLQPEEVELSNIKCHPALWQFDYFTRGQVYQQRGQVPTVPLTKEITLPHRVSAIINARQGTQVRNQLALGYGGFSTEAPYGQQYRDRFEDKGANSTLNEGWVSGNEYHMQNDEGYVHYGTTLGNAQFNASRGTVEGMVGVPIRVQVHDHDLNAEGVGINLNDLTMSMGIMAVLINNAKINYRYIDFLEQRFGIRRQDARLQLAEYINTEVFEITSQGIVQTSYGNVQQGQTPQGYITSQATGQGKGLGTTYQAQEHGYIISILSIVPATMYEQGLPRLLQTKTRYEFATPELTNMPYRDTKKGELYYTQTDKDRETFNWTDVYNEYRTDFNRVTGLLRPSTPNGLPSYTLCRMFTEHPVFNLEFVQVKTDMQRILQYPTQPHFIYMLEVNNNSAAPIPLQSNPAQLLNL